MPVEEQKHHKAILQEIKVALIRNMISQELMIGNIAMERFSFEDLLHIRKRLIGKGRIGGKAVGMLLANRILKDSGIEEISNIIDVPESFFLATDVMYDFMKFNGLLNWASTEI